MDLVSEERRVLDDLSEDEVESVFERAVKPAPQAPAAASEATSTGERLHTLVGRSAALKEPVQKPPEHEHEHAPSLARAPAEVRPAPPAVSPPVRLTAPEPRGGVPPARVALYAALSAIVGSITGAALIGAFAVKLLQVSPAPAPVPAPVTATPAPPAPAPAPPPPAAAPASTAAAPTVHTAPTPVVPPPKARAAVERPKRSAPARKSAPKPGSNEPRHKPRYAPMPKEDPAVADDFERMFGVSGDEG